MPHELEIGMPNPVADSCLGTGEKVVKDGNIVAKKHETVDEMRTDKASSTRDQNTLLVGWGEKFDGREAGEGSVGNGVDVGMVDRLGVVCMPSGEFCMLGFLLFVVQDRRIWDVVG